MVAPPQTALDDTVEILRQIVAFPTVSSDSNQALIAWIEQYLNQHQVPHWRINESATKSSLLARIGPDAPGGIVLSGHTDVVPVQGQPWESDPFTLMERDSRYYGRGTADMKSFLALALSSIPQFKASGTTIWFAFSHDEEIGCLGASPMAKALIERNAAPALVVIGEPTDMRLVDTHKGILSFETIITGHEAHSSMPEQGANAVMCMGELLACLNTIAEAAKVETDADFAAVTPYASVHVGVIEGGTARNIIPRHCRIAWEVRPLPATDVTKLLAPFYAKSAEIDRRIKAVDAKCGVITRPMTQVRGLQKTAPDTPHMALAMRLANSNRAQAVAFGTEGGIFQGHGLPVIVCGPGSIDQAHQPNEYIEAAQLKLGLAFMARIGKV